jgi:hypothetical protein
MEMPCAKPIFYEVGLVYVVKCHVCTKIGRKGQKLLVKWDFIEKHVGNKKDFNGN